MATVTFTVGSAATTVTIVPGSLKLNPQHDDRGGSDVPRTRAGISKAGECRVILTEANLTEIIALRSGAGAGACDVTGTTIAAAEQAYDALVDVAIEGDSVQVATITWKGTKASA